MDGMGRGEIATDLKLDLKRHSFFVSKRSTTNCKIVLLMIVLEKGLPLDL